MIVMILMIVGANGSTVSSRCRDSKLKKRRKPAVGEMRIEISQTWRYHLVLSYDLEDSID